MRLHDWPAIGDRAHVDHGPCWVGTVGVGLVTAQESGDRRRLTLVDQHRRPAQQLPHLHQLHGVAVIRRPVGGDRYRHRHGAQDLSRPEAGEIIGDVGDHQQQPVAGRNPPG